MTNYKNLKVYILAEIKGVKVWQYSGKFRLDTTYFESYANNVFLKRSNTHGVRFVDYKGAVVYAKEVR